MSKTERAYVDIHILQTVPPSCVNRDDTGSPKTAVYGGAVRARVSSQSWKHAVREMFVDIFPAEQLGQRTKRVVEMVAEKITALKPGGDAAASASDALNNAGLKADAKGTDALFFMSDAQAAALAKLSASGESDKKKYKIALTEQPSIDIALFGRMVASDPSMNYDAAVQVAHAISTHAVRNEFDYFTAVDDRAPEDNAGAAHLGTVEFNSSTLYRYATVDLCELERHLGSDAPDALCGFLRAFIFSMPTGKQNTFANRTLPDLVYVAIRSDQPVNLSGAFEQPVKVGPDGGFASASAGRIISFAGSIYDRFVPAPAEAYVTSRFNLKDFAESKNVDEMLDAVKRYASARA